MYHKIKLGAIFKVTTKSSKKNKTQITIGMLIHKGDQYLTRAPLALSSGHASDYATDYRHCYPSPFPL